MVKVTIDGDVCVGCGLCASACPDIFEIGDDSIAKVKLQKNISPDFEDIVNQCPVSAIIVN